MNCSEENTPPHSDFSYYPRRGDSTTVFSFDASLSSDIEDYDFALYHRWDWESDGIWDTDYSQNKYSSHIFRKSGYFNVCLEVKDLQGLTSVFIMEILVGKNLVSTMTDIRDGRTYNTVKISDQWWFAENLKTGKMIDYNSHQENNGIIEKYCYKNDSSYCEKFGGLYNWHEAMSYSLDTATQGICPEGWHVPTKNEWQKLFDNTSINYDNLIGENGYYGTEFMRNFYKWQYGFPQNDNRWIKSYSYWTSEFGGLPSCPWWANPWLVYFGNTSYESGEPLRCVKNI